jgi:hypothetical protein
MKCRICGKTLTGEGSFLGIGPVCRKHRAEAMQLHLEESEATEEAREQFRESEDFEIVDWDTLTGRKGGAGT